VVSILYLHGVGDDGTSRDWVDALGLPAATRISAPDFSDLLESEPQRWRAVGAAALTHRSITEATRRRYRAQQTRMFAILAEARAGSVSARGGVGRVPKVLDSVGEQLVVRVFSRRLANFFSDEGRRVAIRERVLAGLAGHTRVIIVGHSLGAVVALDLIQHLPADVDVPLLITAASPLARDRIPWTLFDLRYHFPYEQVHGWLNVFNTGDVVTRGEPIGARFPQAVDVSVHGSLGDHNLRTCLAEPGVADLVRLAVQPPDQPTDGDESPELSTDQALYLLLVQLTLRILEELPTASATPHDWLRAEAARSLILTEQAMELGVRAADPATDHEETLRRGLRESDIPAILVALSQGDPFSSFSVHVPAAVVRRARERVAAELDLPEQWLVIARRSLSEASAVVAPRQASRGWPGSSRERVHRAADSLELDLTGVIQQMLARARTADLLGMPGAGDAERANLTRLMQELTTVPLPSGTSIANRLEPVANGLTWLARHGLGLGPTGGTRPESSAQPSA